MTTTATTGRYKIGQKIVACFMTLSGRTECFVNPTFVPWTDKLLGIEFEVLTVTEHHKVAWDQDPEGEKKYDGYLLKSADGRGWVNQYPTADYGQVTDRADYLFDKHFPDGTDFDALKPSDLRTYENISTVIDNLKRGIRQLTGREDFGDAAVQLQTHLNWLIKKIKQETGAEVTFEVPFSHHSTITTAVITFKE